MVVLNGVNNLKQWCLDNNVPYKAEWNSLDSYQIVWKVKDIIWDYQDEKLEDKFRRAKYIYHPEHIDTWCRDNNLYYDKNLDNWDNYRKILDYIYLP